MRKELQHSKKGEIEKYLVLLKQEDQKYDFQSSNMERLEQEILKLYKKWKKSQELLTEETSAYIINEFKWSEIKVCFIK